jgi:hypothetical protein
LQLLRESRIRAPPDVEIDGRGDATIPESIGRFVARQYEKSLP